MKRVVSIFLIMAMVEIVCFSWVMGIDVGWEEIHRGSQIQLPRAFRFIMKYVSPVYLLIVLVAFCITSLPASLRQVLDQPMALLAVALIAGVTLVLLWCVRVGERRWVEQARTCDTEVHS